MTTKTAFDAQTPCRRVWEDLMDDGKLNSTAGIHMDITIVIITNENINILLHSSSMKYEY